MPGISSTTLRVITRRFWGVVFTLIIAFAVAVQLGREAFPLLKEYSFEISQRLSDQLGVSISIGEVQAVWEGVRPRIDLINLVVESEDGENIFKISRARAEIDLFESVFKWRLYWQRILLEDMQAATYQDNNKVWQIKGLTTTATTDKNISIDDPLDIFLFGRRVEISNLKLDVTYRTGHVSRVLVPSVTIENEQDFHRIEAKLQIDENEQALKFLVEGRGDPRDGDKFEAKGYLELDKFPMEKVLAATGIEIWDEEKNQHWREGHYLDLKLWLSGSRKAGIQARGTIRADGLPLNIPKQYVLPNEVRSEIFVDWEYKKRWQIIFKDMLVSWPEFSLPLVDVKLYQNAGQAVGLQAQEIKLEDWLKYIPEVGLKDTRLGKTLGELNPSGELTSLDVKFLTQQQQKFSLSANLKGMHVDAFKGSPKIDSIDAFVEASSLEGRVKIEGLPEQGLELYFPKLYEEPFVIKKAKGQVAWKLNHFNRRVLVSSSVLSVRTEGEDVVGKFYLALPYKREYGEPWMTLSLAVKDTYAKKYRKFLPRVVPDNLESWLDRSIGDGKLSNVEFLYNGSTRKDGVLSKNIQFVADVSQGLLAFDEAWPPLEDVSAKIYLDDKNLDVEFSNASILGNHVAKAKTSLVKDAKGGGLGLLITGLIQSDAPAALQLLQNSPVRNAIGKTFDTWEVQGNVNAELELLIPLSADQAKQEQKVRVDFSKASLGITDLNLQLKNVTGTLYYQKDKGLFAKNLSGKLWNEVVTADISSPLNQVGKKETLIEFKGKVSIDDLAGWTQRPELQFAQGATDLTGSLLIPSDKQSDKKLSIKMRSMLKGVSLELPSPVGKNSETPTPFEVVIDVFQDKQHLNFSYNDWIKLNIVRGQSEINSAQILFGEEQREPEAGFFDIAGNIESFSLEEWNLAREKYFEFVAENKNQTQAMPLRFDLSVAHCLVGSLSIENISVAGLGTSGDWTMYLDSEFLKGTVIAYESDRPLFMGLEHIRFPAPEKVEPEKENEEDEKTFTIREINTSALARLKLDQAVPVNFSTKEISFGEENYGAWKFDLRPVEGGIRLENLVAEVRKMKVGSEKAPAEFIWMQKNAENFSSFVGQLSAGNIANVLLAWEQEKLMESKSAKVNVAASWPGAPDEVQLHTIEGLVSLNIQNGNFIRGAKAGENPLLRLIALFNFDTLARRLRLDFSDLAKQGFAFDSVNGEFSFGEGVINLSSPLIVESTSSKMQLTGIIDMVNEQIDSELTVTLPVASNLAVLTAMSAGLPAGVGVYLVSKLFKKQVDKVSSINYSVTGDWNSPKIKVRKVLKDSEPNKEFDNDE